MIRVLGNKQLAPLLVRHMEAAALERDLRVSDFLRLALEKASEFVPSQSGSIFLDESAPKMVRTPPLVEVKLSAVACFGPKATKFLGKKISASRGIVGQVYQSGQPYFSRDVSKDRHFAAEFDKASGHHTRSVLCVPIRIRGSIIGVLELINKKGRRPYSQTDFELLKIFADYISASIQNFLDAKRHYETTKLDTLTGLANDRQLHHVLKVEVARAWRAKKNAGLIFIDLDGFKGINDEHGHLAGSRVLMEVAEVLRQTVRFPKAVLARYGGDEYVVLLPNAGVADAVSVADDIRVAIERAVFLTEESPDVPALRISDQVTASIGVATLREHVGSADRWQLVRVADAAMYEAKHAGKNRVVVASRKGGRALAKSERSC